MYLVAATNISKTFRFPHSEREDLPVVDNFSLEIREGELITLFGPNGCGKTTVLNMLAGILSPTSGAVKWNEGNQDHIELGYVFQNYSDTLLPWRTVRSNIAFPLEIRRMARKEREKRIERRLEQFRLTEHADKYIYELSGGLKQLVAIAQATVYDPRLLMLDEPFSALDYSLSKMLWTRFRELWTDLKVATIFISHNVDEALFLGDRVCVLSSRPTQIVKEVKVPFGKNRSLDLLSSQEFFSIRAEILNSFEKGRN